VVKILKLHYGIATVGVLSTLDVVNLFRGRISGKQLFKNIASTGATVAGGTAGWVGGAAAGAVSSKVSNAVLGAFIEDDADEMVRIIEKVFQQMAEDYLLYQLEAEHIIDKLKDKLTGKTLKDMFESNNRKEFARKLLIDGFESEISKRRYVKLPSNKELTNGLKEVLEEIADNDVA